MEKLRNDGREKFSKRKVSRYWWICGFLLQLASVFTTKQLSIMRLSLMLKWSIQDILECRIVHKLNTRYQAYSWKDLPCKKLYAGLCSGGGQILTSMIIWINTQVDGVPLPLASLLLVHLQHPPHSQQHARVSWRPWGDPQMRINVDRPQTSCLDLCKSGLNDPKKSRSSFLATRFSSQCSLSPPTSSSPPAS